MSMWLIAWRSIQQRGLASSLTAFSMSLGVMLVVAVLSIHGVIQESFRNNANLGYNLIVGAKGGKLQLTLNSVYYLSQPIENVSYDYYMEFLGRRQRELELRNALLLRKKPATGNSPTMSISPSLCVSAIISGDSVWSAPLPTCSRNSALAQEGEREYELRKGGISCVRARSTASSRPWSAKRSPTK